MKIRAQARKRLNFGVMIMATILSILGAQQLRLEPQTRTFLAGDIFPSRIAP